VSAHEHKSGAGMLSALRLRRRRPSSSPPLPIFRDGWLLEARAYGRECSLMPATLRSRLGSARTMPVSR
jgi:hypothetical protein